MILSIYEKNELNAIIFNSFSTRAIITKQNQTLTTRVRTFYWNVMIILMVEAL